MIREGRGERGNELSRVGKGIMRSGMFKSIRKEIKNSVCREGEEVGKYKGEVRKRWGGDGGER